MNVVYTAIYGKYDSLKDPKSITKNTDYICFTNNRKIKSDIWQIFYLDLDFLGKDNSRKARYIKIHPHLYLKEYNKSIWVDASMQILNDFNDLLINHVKENEVLLFEHPFRTCIYNEAIACIIEKKDNANIIQKQILKYSNDNYPVNNGLVETGFMLREHNNKHIILAMEEWWQHIITFSKRDQISFNYIMWKREIDIKYIPGNSRGNSIYVDLLNHANLETKIKVFISGNKTIKSCLKFFYSLLIKFKL